MKIDAELIIELRSERAWTQEELSIASGLNIRTIQRIEKEATLSLQSKKALAAAFDIDIHDLDYDDIPMLKKYEYKTLTIKFTKGFIKKGTPDVAAALNKEAKDGWRLSQMMLPAIGFGETEEMIAILEREVLL